MKFIINLILLIILFVGCFLGWVVLEKTLFYRDNISQNEQSFYNEGLRITSPEVIREANFPHPGVLLGGSLFRYWFPPINDDWQLVNYGGIEEKTKDTYAKSKMVAAELAPEFIIINVGFCEIHTAVHSGRDVVKAIDSIMHHLRLMIDETKSHGIEPILSSLTPVRSVHLLPKSGLIELPSKKKKMEKQSYSNHQH